MGVTAGIVEFADLNITSQEDARNEIKAMGEPVIESLIKEAVRQ